MCIVVDGLKGGSVVNELEGGIVLDGLEGGIVKIESVEYCYQPSDSEEEHGWDQFVNGSEYWNKYWNEDSNGFQQNVFNALIVR